MAGETRRGSYTFGRRYEVGTLKRLRDSEAALRSIDVYENLGVVGRGAFNKIYKARGREGGAPAARRPPT